MGSGRHPGRGEALCTEALVWDQHGCLPLRPEPDLVDELELYRAAGVDVVSINVGMDTTSRADTMAVLAAFREGLLARPDRFVVPATTAEIDAAKATGRIAVTFDLEGTEPLDGDTGLLEKLKSLGVRTVLIAYNRLNRAGGGCHDDPEAGLTAYGRSIVRELNRLGILVDASHCSRRTTFDLFETSALPVVFSHSVPAGVHQHARNVSDDQMRSCAATGGVIGINGVGRFLGNNDTSTEAIVRAIEYALEVVGPDHVGLGLDYVFDQEELNRHIVEHSSTFPAEGGYLDAEPMRFVSPLQLREVANELLENGHREDDVRAILGANFLRVAELVWAAGD